MRKLLVLVARLVLALSLAVPCAVLVRPVPVAQVVVLLPAASVAS